jgi:hypothetical protein
MTVPEHVRRFSDDMPAIGANMRLLTRRRCINSFKRQPGCCDTGASGNYCTNKFSSIHKTGLMEVPWISVMKMAGYNVTRIAIRNRALPAKSKLV